MYGGQLRPKTGAPSLFPYEMECDLALFMKHCCLLRIPRTRNKLKEDIMNYVNRKNMNIPKLLEGGPGECRFYFFS